MNLTDTVLAVRDLSFHRPEGRLVLDQVTLDVFPNSLLAIVGHNGSGKTTLLRIILDTCLGLNTLYRQYTGRLTVAPRSLGDVGYLPQRYSESLLPWFTVRRNLSTMSNSADRSIRQSEVDAVLHRFHVDFSFPSARIAALASRPAYMLSAGEKQAIAFTRAVLPAPGLLLLDEPFSTIDRTYGNLLVEFLRLFQSRTACTTLLVSHDVVEAAYLSDETLVMQCGRLVGRFPCQSKYASKAEALTNPAFLAHVSEITRCLAGAN